MIMRGHFQVVCLLLRQLEQFYDRFLSALA